ncbi:unnamed protein product [Cochlearia groenlandica]
MSKKTTESTKKHWNMEELTTNFDNIHEKLQLDSLQETIRDIADDRKKMSYDIQQNSDVSGSGTACEIDGDDDTQRE